MGNALPIISALLPAGFWVKLFAVCTVQTRQLLQNGLDLACCFGGQLELDTPYFVSSWMVNDGYRIHPTILLVLVRTPIIAMHVGFVVAMLLLLSHYHFASQ